MPPKNRLHPLQFPRKQSQSEFVVDIFCDHLRFLADLENDCLALSNNRHCIIAFPAQSPNQRTVAVRNIDDFELCSRKFEGAALYDAERSPRKLTQLNHFMHKGAPQIPL